MTSDVCSVIRRLICDVCYQTFDFICSVIRRLISDVVCYQTSDFGGQSSVIRRLIFSVLSDV